MSKFTANQNAADAYAGKLLAQRNAARAEIVTLKARIVELEGVVPDRLPTINNASAAALFSIGFDDEDAATVYRLATNPPADPGE